MSRARPSRSARTRPASAEKEGDRGYAAKNLARASVDICRCAAATAKSTTAPALRTRRGSTWRARGGASRGSSIGLPAGDTIATSGPPIASRSSATCSTRRPTTSVDPCRRAVFRTRAGPRLAIAFRTGRGAARSAGQRGRRPGGGTEFISPVRGRDRRPSRAARARARAQACAEAMIGPPLRTSNRLCYIDHHHPAPGGRP